MAKPFHNAKERHRAKMQLAAMVRRRDELSLDGWVDRQDSQARLRERLHGPESMTPTEIFARDATNEMLREVGRMTRVVSEARATRHPYYIGRERYNSRGDFIEPDKGPMGHARMDLGATSHTDSIGPAVNLPTRALKLRARQCCSVSTIDLGNYPMEVHRWNCRRQKSSGAPSRSWMSPTSGVTLKGLLPMPAYAERERDHAASTEEE